MYQQILIAGAGQAAVQAVDTLRRRGFTGKVSFVGEEPWLPYQRPPLSKKYLAGGLERERLLIRPPPFFADHQVTAHLGQRITEIARRAADLMPNGGAMVTLTYNGGSRTMPNYNAMGIAKAALEASVRYLAVDFGANGIRVNAISAGPIRTLAGAGISDARFMFAFQQRHSPLRRGVTLEELGGAGLYLLSDLSTGVTGEIHFVDCGYNIIAMPHPDALRVDAGSDE